MADFVRVFVYGTLKRGFPNHGLLGNPPQGIVKFITEGRTKQRYPLVIATEAGIPFVLPFPGEGEVSWFSCTYLLVRERFTAKSLQF